MQLQLLVMLTGRRAVKTQAAMGQAYGVGAVKLTKAVYTSLKIFKRQFLRQIFSLLRKEFASTRRYRLR
ncbi:hypothetical protein X474_01755 [Dethiosulfatarculus sandiegensis]|uniref:Uncharacterized protein n=1 Tax=Dethiosulfatarculus sandiegensis TaxID=1429043 RepID=A0A0D2JKE1_9BACT|nr:hypothetical protein X474_01755 [Dethiosulfatarculus sandiegensis]